MYNYIVIESIAHVMHVPSPWWANHKAQHGATNATRLAMSRLLLQVEMDLFHFLCGTWLGWSTSLSTWRSSGSTMATMQTECSAVQCNLETLGAWRSWTLLPMNYQVQGCKMQGCPTPLSGNGGGGGAFFLSSSSFLAHVVKSKSYSPSMKSKQAGSSPFKVLSFRFFYDIENQKKHRL